MRRLSGGGAGLAHAVRGLPGGVQVRLVRGQLRLRLRRSVCRKGWAGLAQHDSSRETGRPTGWSREQYLSHWRAGKVWF